MSSANNLPSAPPENIYPQIIPTDFRIQKVNEISTALNKEVGHYRAVAKKYKRAKKVFNWSAAGSSVLSAAFSSASFGSALSFVGLPATIPRAVPSGGPGGGQLPPLGKLNVNFFNEVFVFDGIFLVAILVQNLKKTG